MENMKAVRVHNYGGPDVLRFEDAPRPTPGSGELLVKVQGVVLGAVIPFTLLVILPTNKQLLNPRLDRQSPQTERLLARWGRLHAVRSALSGLALLLFLYLVIFKKPL